MKNEDNVEQKKIDQNKFILFLFFPLIKMLRKDLVDNINANRQRREVKR